MGHGLQAVGHGMSCHAWRAKITKQCKWYMICKTNVSRCVYLHTYIRIYIYIQTIYRHIPSIDTCLHMGPLALSLACSEASGLAKCSRFHPACLGCCELCRSATTKPRPSRVTRCTKLSFGKKHPWKALNILRFPRSFAIFPSAESAMETFEHSHESASFPSTV